MGFVITRTLIADIRRWGIRTAWWNLRYNLGYKIGGFTSATREAENEA